MVIEGTNEEGTYFAVAKFVGDRVRLPVQFVELAGLAGKAPVNFWLLVVKPGRYRLLMQSAAAKDRGVSKLLRRIKEAEEPAGMLEEIESDEEATVGARLIPCVVSPRGPGWRVHLPKEAKRLASGKEEFSFVFLLNVAGYVEIWFPDTLTSPLSVPVFKILS